MYSKDMQNKMTQPVTRRELFCRSGHALAIGALGATALGSGLGPKFAGDLAILNVALGLEHQAIAAYDAGAGSKLLSADQLKLAVSFQNTHKRHREVLMRYIRRFGGTAVTPKSSYDFGTITSAADIIKLAHSLEEGAAKAYLANAYKLENREILNALVPILADQIRQTTVLNQVLGLSVTDRITV